MHHHIISSSNVLDGTLIDLSMDAQLQQIITECRRGKLPAQKRLFERYQARLFVVCLRYARDRPEAKDMLQEAFLAIFRDLGQYSGQGSFDGWVHRIAVRASLLYLRKRNPLRFADDYADMPDQSSVTLPDSEFTKEAILQCVQRLPIGYRTIFNMHCLEAWSYPEIAAELGISESSVRSQYSRACKHLRELVNHLFTFTL